MARTWLILDCNYLMFRAHHSTGHLQDKDGPTGAVYGFFRAVEDLRTRFNAHNRTVFCFDRGRSKRYALCPTYKSKREMTPEKKEVHRQIDLLRRKYLKRAGCRNVFSADGYEADDVIASLVLSTSIPVMDLVVIASADKDLYQLLGPRVSVYNPTTKVLRTRESFEREYGVNPAVWSTVKALAGCGTDEVPGLPGVGEKTAVKFLTSVNRPTGKVADTIRRVLRDKKWMRRQIKLVGLPFPGCPAFRPVKDVPDPDRYARLMARLGFESLAGGGRG